MVQIFKLMESQEKGASHKKSVRLALDLKIGDKDVPFSVSEACSSYEAFAKEVERVREELAGILKRAKDLFSGPSEGAGRKFRADATPEEIWSELSKTEDEDFFVSIFNGLDDRKRREVAEFVLTQCNVFSGKASAFSSRYNNESGLLE